MEGPDQSRPLRAEDLPGSSLRAAGVAVMAPSTVDPAHWSISTPVLRLHQDTPSGHPICARRLEGVWGMSSLAMGELRPPSRAGHTVSFTHEVSCQHSNLKSEVSRSLWERRAPRLAHELLCHSAEGPRPARPASVRPLRPSPQAP